MEDSNEMTSKTRHFGSVTLWLSSRFENIELALAALAVACRERAVSDETEHWIGLAMREAVANAIRHGNMREPLKRVCVTIDGDDEELKIVVGDEGGGFDQNALADPLAPENAMKTSGRGIFYIRSFMDDLRFSRGENGGTVVTMKKNLKQKQAAFQNAST